jgi:hypothetical protein
MALLKTANNIKNKNKIKNKTGKNNVIPVRIRLISCTLLMPIISKNNSQANETRLPK